MAQRERAQHPGQAPASSDAVEKPHEGEKLGWAQLDKGLLPVLASRLDVRSVGRARLMCRQWAAELPQGCTRLKVKGPGPAGWEHRFCGLEDLKWRYPEYAGPLWPKLRTLTLEDCRDVDLRMLKDLPGLASLNLPGCDDVTDTGLEELKHVPLLTSLDMSYCEEVTDTGLEELKHLTALTSLDLSECREVTDAGLKELKHLTALTSLKLSGCSRITDAGLKELKHLTCLTSLHLSYCWEVTDAGLKELKPLSSLTSLKLSRCWRARITDVGLDELVEHISTLTCVD